MNAPAIPSKIALGPLPGLFMPGGRRIIVPTPGMNAVTLSAARPSDMAWIASLREDALRPSVETCVGHWDEAFQRERLARDADLSWLKLIELNGEVIGTIQAKPIGRDFHLSLFYLPPELQGLGLGHDVLTAFGWHADETDIDLTLTVLIGSRAAKLYLRHGFTLQADTRWEHVMRRRANRRA